MIEIQWHNLNLRTIPTRHPNISGNLNTGNEIRILIDPLQQTRPVLPRLDTSTSLSSSKQEVAECQQQKMKCFIRLVFRQCLNNWLNLPNCWKRCKLFGNNFHILMFCILLKPALNLFFFINKILQELS